MSYTALYRKFRPDNFEDVKGQDHIVKTLKNQIMAQRIGHAYLFCGTRGTGKTTIAKILAKAVNCENPQNGSPCNECSMCKKINNRTSMNVIEIDAASNNGVDNIREIVDEVQYSPTEGRYKVYIIDEVHMLSTGAFNALLKTLEEPPAYIIFILATTEVHKIPITILSRCQRYDFKRITIDTITDRLMELMSQEGVETEERALRYVSKAADGSMRDALSLLDQCIAFNFGEKLTFDKVLDVLGAVDAEVFYKLIDVVRKQDVLGAIQLVEQIVIEGRELNQFVIDFTWYLRNLLLLKVSENGEEIIDASSEQIKYLKENAEFMESEMIMRYIRIFSDLSNQLKYATQKRVLLELAIIKLCKPAMEINLDSLLERVRTIEEKMQKGLIQVQPEAENMVQEQPVSTQSVLEKTDLPKALPEDIKQAAKEWQTIISLLSPYLKARMNNATPVLGNNGALGIVFYNEIDYKVMSEQKRIEEIENAARECIGKEIHIEVKYVNQQNQKENIVDISKKVNMEIEIEE